MAQPLADGIRLIACDLDGTLLRDHVKDVDPRAYPIIERLCDTGAYFFAASGRQYASLKRLFAPVADRIGYICENGALAILNGEVLVQQGMPRDLALQICKMVDETPGCSYLASGIKTAYAPAREKAFIDHLVNDVKNDIAPVEQPEDIPEEIIKVAFQFEDPHKMEPARLRFEEALAGRCRVVTSGTTWLDCIVPGVNKGTAIEALAAALDIDIADIAAFGDEENDREILETVGHPYLMDPCGTTMLDLAALPQTRRCTCVEDELLRLMDEA